MLEHRIISTCKETRCQVQDVCFIKFWMMKYVTLTQLNVLNVMSLLFQKNHATKGIIQSIWWGQRPQGCSKKRAAPHAILGIERDAEEAAQMCELMHRRKKWKVECSGSR